jgi:hypothetical protein
MSSPLLPSLPSSDQLPALVQDLSQLQQMVAGVSAKRSRSLEQMEAMSEGLQERLSSEEGLAAVDEPKLVELVNIVSVNYKLLRAIHQVDLSVQDMYRTSSEALPKGQLGGEVVDYLRDLSQAINKLVCLFSGIMLEGGRKCQNFLHGN